MFPRKFSEKTPDKAAVILEPSGARLSFSELENQANQAAQYFRSIGLKAGDVVAVCLENTLELFPYVWGVYRSGLVNVPISSRLKSEEIAYILKDSGAKVLLTSDYLAAEVLSKLPELCSGIEFFTKDQPQNLNWRNWAEEIAKYSTSPIPDEKRGIDMLYSSGTTGHPKGIIPKHNPDQPLDEPDILIKLLDGMFELTSSSSYLCPAPLYHAAPLRWSCSVMSLGATVVVLEKYDPKLALDVIERYKITHAQFVPTHFIRMLKLPEEIRTAFDVSSLELVLHAAAPCPVPVKEAMIDWWGPVIHEFYAGSEANGMTFIRAKDWLEHKGSVGKPVTGSVYVCDDQGEVLGPKEEGLVFFDTDNSFSYHNDKAKTDEAHHPKGWSTLGDVGWLDEDGFLYLTDRKSFMIISGGVNIYPQEIENLLVTHPKVADVAVIGAPDPDMGEKVVAVVQPLLSDDANDAFAGEIVDFCRKHLSGVKVPRQVDFVDALPRADTGKLYKKQIRQAYWD